MDEDFYIKLCKYIDGDADASETKDVLLWLMENPDNAHEYITLRRLHYLRIWNLDESDVISAESTAGYKSPSVSPHANYFPANPDRETLSTGRIAIEILKYAAVLAIGVFCTLYVISKQPEEPILSQTVIVPFGQRTELRMSDGTIVWLNSGSTLVYPEKFSKTERKVSLNGEAYFKVNANKERPFTVQTPRYNLKVLGTEFNVKDYKRSPIFEASLLKGALEIMSITSGDSLALKPNDKVLLKDGRLITGSIGDPNYYKWREGLICFENETIGSLFAKLELYYDIKIEVQKPSLLNHTYTGKFRVRDGIEHVLKVLQLKHHFHFRKVEDTNTIFIS